MSSFVNMELKSDSESDDSDFVPEASRHSDDSGSDVENSSKVRGNKGKLKKVPKQKSARKMGGIFLEEENTKSTNSERQESRIDEFEQEKIERKELEEKKRSDDLWADFKRDTSSIGNSKDKYKEHSNETNSSVSGGLGVFTLLGQPKRNSQSKTNPSVIKKSQNKSIMSSIFEEFENKTTSKPESERNAPNLANNLMPQGQKNISSIFESNVVSEPKKSDESDSKFTAGNDKPESTCNLNGNKITVVKKFDFAGECVEVTKQVSKDSKEAQRFLKTEKDKVQDGTSFSAQKRGSSGLSSIMGVISGKKPKMGCLDKSKIDWDKFTDEQGIKEELNTYNKGKDGYVEKQMFLDRADYRRFEIERAAREKTRKPLNK